MAVIIQIITGTIVAIIGTCVAVIHKKMELNKKQHDTEQTALKCGMQALLRDRLIQAYKYSVEKEYCPIYERESIEEMYNQYKNLGGNGTITNLMSKLRELPTEKEDNYAK